MAVNYADIGQNHIAAIADHTIVGHERLRGITDVFALFSHRNAGADDKKLPGKGEKEVVRNTTLGAITIVNATNHGVVLQHNSARTGVDQILVPWIDKVGVENRFEGTKCWQGYIVGEEIRRSLISEEMMRDINDVGDRDRIFKVIIVQNSDGGSNLVTDVRAI